MHQFSSAPAVVQLADDRLAVALAAHGELTVTDRANGHVYRTHGPPLELHLWDRMMDRPLALPAEPTAARWVVRTGRVRGTARLTVHWPRVAVTLELALRLLPGGALQVTLDPARLREENAAHFRVLGLAVLPAFGAARRGQEGYLVLPGGSGLLSRFTADKVQPAEYRRWVYLDQGEWEAWCNLPLLGLRLGPGAAWLAIIEQGDFASQLVARYNPAGTDLVTAHVHWHLREGKVDPIDPQPRVLRYQFLHGDRATYAGMAGAYRDYLLTERGATLLRDRAAASPHLAYEATAHTCKVFLASKSRRPAGDGRYDRFTTFAEAAKVAQAFKAAGLERVSYQLVGWNRDGHDGCYPRRFPVDARIGGRAGLRRFVRTAQALGHRTGVHDNYVDAYAAAPERVERLLARDRDGEPIIGGIWSGGQMVYLCGSQALHFARRDMPRVASLGLDGIYYLDAMPRVSRACHAPHHGHVPGRRADGEGVVALLQYARQALPGHPVGCENLMGFTIPCQDYAGHIPHHLPTRAVPREFADETIPLCQLAVHGLLKYHLADPRAAGSPAQAPAHVLHELEYGALPRFEYQYRDHHRGDAMQFHFGDWRPWLPVMQMQYRLLCDQLGHLQFALMVDHQRDADGLARTTYSDGTELLIDHARQRFALGQGTPWHTLRLPAS